MPRLIFSFNELRPLIDHAKAANSTQATMDQKWEWLAAQGVPEDQIFHRMGEMTEADNNAAAKPGLILVKDDGIYLMSNGGGEKSLNVAYASGYNPKVDGDVWDKCRDAVGGDDFALDIPAAVSDHVHGLPAGQKGALVVLPSRDELRFKILLH